MSALPRLVRRSPPLAHSMAAGIRDYLTNGPSEWDDGVTGRYWRGPHVNKLGAALADSVDAAIRAPLEEVDRAE